MLADRRLPQLERINKILDMFDTAPLHPSIRSVPSPPCRARSASSEPASGAIVPALAHTAVGRRCHAALLLLALAACHGKDEADTESESGGASSTSTGDTGGVDPGDVELLECGQAEWVRIDPVANAYLRVHNTPGGGSVASGHTLQAAGVQGVVHRRGRDAEVEGTILGSAPFGSIREVVGVDSDGRYVVTGTDFIDEECHDNPEEGPFCSPIGTHWLRMYGADDTVLWERGDAERAFRAIGVDPEGRTIVADPLAVHRYDSAGTLEWTKPTPETTYLMALAGNGGFFAYRYLDPPAKIARLDGELEVLWEVEPEADFGIEGGQAPPEYTLLSPTPDGGVAIVGAAIEGLRVIRISPQGAEMWRDDLDVGQVWESALASGPAGEVGVTSLQPSPGGGVHGWIRLYAVDGTPAWTIHCAGPRGFDSLAIDSTGVLVAGRLQHGADNSQGFLAKYAKDTPDQPFHP